MVDQVDDNVMPFQMEDPSSSDMAQAIRANTALLQRIEWMTKAGLRFGGKRDLYETFGYVKTLRHEDFWAKYIRQDVAARVVDAPPDAIWSNPPEVTFGGRNRNNAWVNLLQQVDFWGALNQADKFNRLETFSLILVGVDDGRSLEKPIGNANKVLYLRAIPAHLVQSVTLNGDARNERYGKPEMYKINSSDPARRTIAQGVSVTSTVKSLDVHASRIVHITEYPLEDEVTGVPIIERVFNLLDDLLKVSGGTAETYWLTSNRGMQVDVDKEMQLNPDDAAALEEELDEFHHQLRRYVRTRGVTINSLGADTPKPKEVFEMLIALLSGATGIPKRILTGSEAGQLASEQDRANWAERLVERRNLFCGPRILMPLVRILQACTILPAGQPELVWPEAFILSPLERAQTMAQTARAVGNISRQVGNKNPMQLLSRDEGREVLGYTTPLGDTDIYASDPLKLTDEESKQVAGINPEPEDDSGTGSQGAAGGSEADDDQQDE